MVNAPSDGTLPLRPWLGSAQRRRVKAMASSGEAVASVGAAGSRKRRLSRASSASLFMAVLAVAKRNIP
jgi:hypothetical protein